MDSTPPKSKLSLKESRNKKEIKKENDPAELLTSTPSNNKNQHIDQENDYSPLYFPSTQEANEDIDVLWDWHSPQSSQRRRKKQKRLLPVQSPKLPVKKQPSNNQQNFEKLKNELKVLKEELALPDDESCLCISPQQEVEFKEDKNTNFMLKKEEDHEFGDFNDMFDDSVDEQLLLCSQQVENNLLREGQINQHENDSLAHICDNTEIDNLINKYINKNQNETKNITMEVFHSTLNNIKEENIIIDKKNITPLPRTVSENEFYKGTRKTQIVSDKLEFQRTRSFELPTSSHSQINLPKSTLEEIERKRLEAKARLESKKKQSNAISLENCLISEKLRLQRTHNLEAEINHNQISLPPSTLKEIERKRLEAKARLESKKKQEKLSCIKNTVTSPTKSFCENFIETLSGKLEFYRTKSFEMEAVSQIDLPKNTLDEIERKRLEAKTRLESKKKQVISPTKCSVDEIEKKRLQALAKLEAKRLQDIVEKKRQEALKRLQTTRMKANLVKSTLTTRL